MTEERLMNQVVVTLVLPACLDQTDVPAYRVDCVLAPIREIFYAFDHHFLLVSAHVGLTFMAGEPSTIPTACATL